MSARPIQPLHPGGRSNRLRWRDDRSSIASASKRDLAIVRLASGATRFTMRIPAWAPLSGANCHVNEYGPTPPTTIAKIYVVNLADGSARDVIHGPAYDWHVPAP
jgi:hypothetical protein